MDCSGRVGKEPPIHQPTPDTIFYKKVLVFFSVVDPTHWSGSDSPASDPAHHCDPDTLMRIRPTVTEPTYLLFFFIVSDPDPALCFYTSTLMWIRFTGSEPVINWELVFYIPDLVPDPATVLVNLLLINVLVKPADTDLHGLLIDCLLGLNFVTDPHNSRIRTDTVRLYFRTGWPGPITELVPGPALTFNPPHGIFNLFYNSDSFSSVTVVFSLSLFYCYNDFYFTDSFSVLTPVSFLTIIYYCYNYVFF